MGIEGRELQEGVEGDSGTFIVLGMIMVISVTHFQCSHLPRLEKDITGSPLATQPVLVFFNKTSTTIIPTPFNNHHFSSNGKIHFAYLRNVCSTFLIHFHLPLHNFNWSQPWETEENSNLPSFSCLSPRLPPPFLHRLSFLL